MASASYRDYLTSLGPSWLQGTWGGRLLGTLGRALDITLGALQAAVAQRSVSACYADALPMHGRDRVLERYPHDTDETYRARLGRAWDLWARAGTIEGVELALETAGFYAAEVCPVTGPKPGWWDAATGSAAWPPRGLSDWSRYVVYLPANPYEWAPREWGAFTYGEKGPDGTPYVWGSTATVAQVEMVRRICRTWAPARDRLDWIAVRLDGGREIRWRGEV